MIVEFEGQSYTLDVDDIDVLQATMIKIKTGFNLLEWQAALERVDVDAVKALYWLMLEQNGKRQNYDSLNFKVIRFGQAVTAAQKAEAPVEENPTDQKQNSGSGKTSES